MLRDDFTISSQGERSPHVLDNGYNQTNSVFRRVMNVAQESDARFSTVQGLNPDTFSVLLLISMYIKKPTGCAHIETESSLG